MCYLMIVAPELKVLLEQADLSLNFSQSSKLYNVHVETQINNFKSKTVMLSLQRYYLYQTNMVQVNICNQAIIGPQAKRHSSGILLVG